MVRSNKRVDLRVRSWVLRAMHAVICHVLHAELGMSHRTRAPHFPIVRSEVVNESAVRPAVRVRGNLGPSASLGGRMLRPSGLYYPGKRVLLD